MFFEILEKARKLSEKVLRCKRYNPKHIYHANEMKELERKITRLLSSSVLVDILADVNDVPFVLMLLHRYVVDERKGLPLSLKVLGAFLKDRPERYWEGVVKKLSRGETADETHESRVFAHIEESLKNPRPESWKVFLGSGCFP
ncbi:hypothetical protein Bca4012_094059 [Brassica carinata]|uniref:Uncharacterized protein n=2 Tax=Brassica TaxID=3705 RepID=A0A0D3DPJ0_BRAOL|nr:unnamed protein product [Brassica napus]